MRRAGSGRVPARTEYQASQPAVSPAAAVASPEMPMLTWAGTTARISRTRARACWGSAGTPGILREAIPVSCPMRP